jgi:hypothetical protein
MSVLPFPPRAQWAWDARGHNRAVRVSPHPQENVVNLSVWRDELCVGTVRLQPDDVAALIAGLGHGLAELANRPGTPSATVAELADRLTRVETRLARPGWRTAATAAVARFRMALRRAPGPRSPLAS